MSEETKNTKNNTPELKKNVVAAPSNVAGVIKKEVVAPGVLVKNEKSRSMYAKKFEGRGFGRRPREKEEFEQKVVDLARVTRVMGGGKRMSFRACVAIGDGKGRVAVGLSKGADVALAISKSVAQAKKSIINVPMNNNTIPHEVLKKCGAARILFKPAKAGNGVIAGGVVKIVLELAGIKDITSKILGTNNKVSNAKCTIEALKDLRK